MPVRIKYDIDPDYVRPKLEDLDVVTVTLDQYVLKPTGTVNAMPPKVTEKNQDKSSKDSWYSWTISLSLDGLKPVIDQSNKFFKEVDRIISQITQLLKIIRLLSGNVISVSMFFKFTLKMLAKELKGMIDSLASTGLYMSLIVPDFDKKFPKYTIPIFGGYQEFITRVNATCLASTDSDAPKFDDADKVGGVIIAMLGGVNDPDFLRNLVENFKKLSELFGFQIPYPSPAMKFKATAGFYGSSDKKLGVKFTWESPATPVKNFLIYRTENNKGIPLKILSSGFPVDVNVFSVDEPLTIVEYKFGKVLYSYIDFSIKPETTYYYKIYSVYGSGTEYIDENPVFMATNSPIATPTLTVTIPQECIPVSELKKYMSMSMRGELLSPFDLEGDWQSISVRTMLGSKIDSMFNAIDALTEKLTGMVSTGSDAVNDYIKFYGERVSDLLEVIEKIKTIMIWLSQFTMRGTFMILSMPLEEGGMRGFVDRFNKACNYGDSDKATAKDYKIESTAINKAISDAGKSSGIPVSKNVIPAISAKVEKNTPISAFNERGIMLGLILLYGIPNLNDKDRLKRIVPEANVESLKKQLKQTEKATSTLLKMLGLE